MLVCLNYRNGNRYNNEAGEFKIKVSKNIDNKLFDFIQQYKDKKLMIDITELDIESNMTVLSTLAAKNVTYILSLEQEKYLYLFDEENIKYCFNVGVDNWDTLHAFIKLRVSEMYITNELCFDLSKVRKVLRDADIRMRTYANVAQSRDNFGVNSTLKAFFIRPEDLFLFEEIFDSIEFFGPEDREEVLYKIYVKDKKWFGDLREVIIGLREEIDSRFLIPYFAVRRLDCGKRCYKGSHCQICERTIELMKVMEENNMMVKLEEKREKDEESKQEPVQDNS